MAGYHAIGAIGQTICQLLKSAAAPSEFARAQFELLTPADLQASPPRISEGAGLMLYRVGINGSRRSLPPRLGLDGIRRRPPLPVDLHYLLSCWASSAEKQHHLLGLCMRALHGSALIAPSLLNQNLPPRSQFQPDEGVELVCEPLSLQDMSYLADSLRQLLSVTFVARRVLLDSDLSLDEYELVGTRIFDAGAEQPA